VRPLLVSIVAIAAAAALAACGTESIEVAESDPGYDGAVLFSERCSGCHTLKAAGAEGSANRALRNQGPNLDQRTETAEDVLFAIRNGGFSGAIMPQNIVVGEEAEAVAEFVEEYAGSDVDRPPRPDTEGAQTASEEERDASIESEASSDAEN
jgi:mono/diheme cytochrome c family protein